MSGLISTNIRTITEVPSALEKTLRYGVLYDINDSNPALMRLYNSVGMMANAGNSLIDNPRNDFDTVYPFNEIKEETINGRIMIKIPKFYIKREFYNNTMEIVICEKKYDSSYIPHEMFLKGSIQWTGYNLESDYNDYTYVSKYETSSNNQSTYGANVQVLQTRNEMRTYARNIGDGWSILDIATWDGLQKLFMIVFATRNSNSIMDGNSSVVVQKTGITRNCKASCVQISNTAMSFYGIENLYKNIYKAIDGLNIDSKNIYMSTNIRDYGGSIGSYSKINYQLITGSGYVKKLGFDVNNKFIQLPIEIGGSSTTFFVNNISASSSALILCVGGGPTNIGGLFGGLTASSLENEVGEISIGSRLIFRPI